MSCTTHILAQTKLLVGAGNQVAIMKQTMLEKPAKKNRNLFFITFFSPDEEKRFLLAFLTGDKPFVTFFIVVLVDADLNFLLTELEFWMDFSMESACFCQIRSVNFEQREFL